MTKHIHFLFLLIFLIANTSCSNEVTQEDDLIITDNNTPEEEPKDTPTTEPNDPAIYNSNLFYTEPNEDIKNNITNYPDTNNELNDGDDSSEFKSEINRISREGGGILKIPAGYYYLNSIPLKSNVHLQFDSGATIIPATTNTSRIFNLGMVNNETGRIENVSITSSGTDKFTVDFTNPAFFNQNIAFIRVGRINNFKLSDFTIHDRRTSLASITISYVGNTSETKPWSSNGVIENINQTNSHTGYGLIQGYAGDHLLFKNIECEGGITLRLETDDRTMKDEIKDGTKEGGVKNIFAYDIRGTKGLTTIMLSPHFCKNGTITIDKVKATGSCFP